MGNWYKKIGVAFIVFAALVACDEFEMRGFVASYESVDQRFDQSMEWNNTHPFLEISVPSDEYHIFVMGDSHVGGTKNLDVFLLDAINSKAAAAVMNGDLTTGHAEDFETFWQHLPDPDSLVTFQIPGNHDLYFNGWKQFYSLFGSSTYLFTIESSTAKDLFICLDSGGGTLGRKQLDWLKDILETERPNFRRCIVFTHNNLFRIRHTFSTNPQVEELYVLAEWCVKYEIDLVVGAHDHARNITRLGNTTFLTLDALIDQNSDASYLNLSCKEGKLTYEFVDL